MSIPYIPAFKFVPGPWVVREPLSSSRRVFIPNDTIEIGTEKGGLVACLYATNWSWREGLDRANANLLSAAPDLYAALAAIMSNAETPPGRIAELASNAVKALRKADGE